jgi:hypothetical protein
MSRDDDGCTPSAALAAADDDDAPVENPSG